MAHYKSTCVPLVSSCPWLSKVVDIDGAIVHFLALFNMVPLSVFIYALLLMHSLDHIILILIDPYGLHCYIVYEKI